MYNLAILVHYSRFIYFYLHRCLPTCMFMYSVTPDPALRGHGRMVDPYEQSFRWVWGPMWVLIIKLKSPGRTTSALSCYWVFKVHTSLNLLWQIYSHYSWHVCSRQCQMQSQDCFFPVVLLLLLFLFLFLFFLSQVILLGLTEVWIPI